MSETVSMSGGFNRGVDHLSPSLAARVLAADAQHDRAAARVEREREVLLERRREVDIAESVRLAEESGEIVDRRARRDGIGHTRQEFVALCSARSDLEDAQERGREAARIRRFLAGEDDYGDASAPLPSEVAEGEILASRAANYRAKRAERGKILRQARTLSRLDRER